MCKALTILEIEDATTVDNSDKCVERLANYWQQYDARAMTYDSTDGSCRYFRPANSDNIYTLVMQSAMTSYVASQMD